MFNFLKSAKHTAQLITHKIEDLSSDAKTTIDNLSTSLSGGSTIPELLADLKDAWNNANHTNNQGEVVTHEEVVQITEEGFSRLANILDNANFPVLSTIDSDSTPDRNTLILALLHGEYEVDGHTLTFEPVHSAIEVTGYSLHDFVNSCGKLFESESLCRDFYKSAAQIKSLVLKQYFNLRSQTGSDGREVPYDNHDVSNYTGLPNYKELFGVENHLKVDHNESVLSPAAYLADLVSLVKNYIVPIAGGVYASAADGKAVLDTRRPDIDLTEITAAATITEVPTIQLVTKALEDLIKDTLNLNLSPETSVYPPALDKLQQQIGKVMQLLNSSLSEAWATTQHPSNGSIIPAGWMHWNIAVYEYNHMITTAATGLNATSATDYLGLDARLGLYDSSNLLSMDNLTPEVFMAKAHVSIQELKEAIYAGAATTEQSETLPYLYLNNHSGSNTHFLVLEASEGDYSFKIDNGSGATSELTATDFTYLDRLYRLVRLSKLTGISYAGMHWLLSMKEFATVPSAKISTDILVDSGDSFCAWVAAIQQLAKNQGIAVTEAAARLGYVKPYGEDFGDYENLWDYLFEGVLERATTWAIDDDTQVNKITQAFHLSKEELIAINTKILSSPSGITLGEAVHVIHRVARAAQTFDITIQDFITLTGLDLISKDIKFSATGLFTLSATPQQCREGFEALSDFMGAIQAADISIEEVLIMAGEGDSEDLPTDLDLQNIAKDLESIYAKAKNIDEDALREEFVSEFSQILAPDEEAPEDQILPQVYETLFDTTFSRTINYTYIDGRIGRGAYAVEVDEEGNTIYPAPRLEKAQNDLYPAYYENFSRKLSATLIQASAHYADGLSGATEFAEVMNSLWPESEMLAEYAFYSFLTAAKTDATVSADNLFGLDAEALFAPAASEKRTALLDRMKSHFTSKYANDSDDATTFLGYQAYETAVMNVLTSYLELTDEQSAALLRLGNIFDSDDWKHVLDIFREDSSLDQLAYLKALHRLATLIKKLDLSARQITHICDLYTAIVSSSALLSSPGDLVMSPYLLKNHLLPLDTLVKRYQHSEENILAVLQPDNTNDWTGTLMKVTSWSNEFIDAVLGAWNFTGYDAAGISGTMTVVNVIEGLQSIADYVLKHFIHTDTLLGMFSSMATPGGDLSVLAEHLQSAVHAKNQGKERESIENALLLGVEEAYRDYLVYQVLHFCHTSTDDLWSSIQDSNSLSEYMLTDVMVTSKIRTSQVKFAISALQTLINRTDNGLESGLEISDFEFDELWSWFKHYRVWEANRKQFLFPENYLDPEFLPDASSQFKTFVSTVNSSKISDDIIQQAYQQYLADVAALNKLTHVNSYFYSSHEESKLFVLATSNDDQKYYLRTLKLHGNLGEGHEFKSATPWREVSIPIDDNVARVVYAFGRVFVFYLDVTQSSPISDKEDRAGQSDGYALSIKYIYEDLNGNFHPAKTLATIDCQNYQPTQAELEIEHAFSIIHNIVNSFGEEDSHIANSLLHSTDNYFIDTGKGDDDTALYRYPKNPKEFQKVLEKAEGIFEFALNTDAEDNIHVKLVMSKELLQDTTALDQAWILHADYGVTRGDWSTEYSAIGIRLLDTAERSVGYDKFHLMASDGTLGTLPTLENTNLLLDLGDNIIQGAYPCTAQETLVYTNIPHRRKLTRLASWFKISDYTKKSVVAGLKADDKLFAYWYIESGKLWFAYVEGHAYRRSIATIDKDTWYYIDYTAYIDFVKLHNHKTNQYRMGLDVGYAQAHILKYNEATQEAKPIFHSGSFNTKRLVPSLHGNHPIFDASVYYFLMLGEGITGHVINMQAHPILHSFNPHDTLLNETGFIDGEVPLITPEEDDTEILLEKSIGHGLALLQPIDAETRKESSELYLRMKVYGTDTNEWRCIRITSNAFASLEKTFAETTSVGTLLSPEAQLTVQGSFQADLEPANATTLSFPEAYWPTDDHIDLASDNAVYFRELFVWSALAVAQAYNRMGNYESAQTWYKKVFNPSLKLSQLSDDSPLNHASLSSDPDTKDIYWQYIGLRSKYLHTLNAQLFADTAANVLDVVGNAFSGQGDAIETYYEDPFDPDAIAALRPKAYQEYIVKSYIQNLVDWGDSLYQELTRESLVEAYQFYEEAHDLLGLESKKEADTFSLPDGLTLGTLEKESVDLYHGGYVNNFLVGLEEKIDPQSIPVVNAKDAHQGPAYNHDVWLYFGTPENTDVDLLRDTLEQRFHNLRNNLDIHGNELHLPLFAPPIDPGNLIRANASGNLGTALASGGSVSVQPHRFHVQLGQAREFTQYVANLGDKLLGIAREKDAEDLAHISLGQQAEVLKKMQEIKDMMVNAAKADLDTIEQRMLSALLAKTYIDGLRSRYRNIGKSRKTSFSTTTAKDWSKAGANGEADTKTFGKGEASVDLFHFKYAHNLEIAASVFEGIAVIEQYLAANIHSLSAPFHLLPEIFGLADGGMKYGDAVQAMAGSLGSAAFADSFMAGMLKSESSYSMRLQEWDHQSQLIDKQVEELKHSWEATTARYNVALQDQELQQTYTRHHEEITAFYRDKYTNQELLTWLKGRLTTLYKQAYQLAVDQAVKAEQAFEFEKGLALNSLNIVNQSSWNSKYYGLLSAEPLMHSLHTLEQRYLKEDYRRMEITEVFSLAERLANDDIYDADSQSFHEYLVSQRGSLTFSFTDDDFETYYPNYYCRQIKMITLAIPSLLGPYKMLHGTLEQTNNTLVVDGSGATTRNVKAPCSKIAISMAMGETGMHGGDGGRYMPFEGTGVASDWVLNIADDLYGNGHNGTATDGISISDIIVTMHYTAIE